MPIHIEPFFDQATSTFTYVVFDMATRKTAIIDSVLNYDFYSGRSSTSAADKLIAYLKKHELSVEWILETHIHADHLTASSYLREKVGGKIGIGARIKEVLALWVPIFNNHHDTPLDASQFDQLFADHERIKLGEVEIQVWHTPGHTPACSCYLIEDAVFVGDTIFMPDLGTARTDFPGGDAAAMYDSIQRLFSLPDETRIFMCHDYPPEGRAAHYVSTVKAQKEHNVLLNAGTLKEDYIVKRNKRDEGKAIPKLLLPSIQVNLRAGTFGAHEANGMNYVKIPVNKF